MEKNDTDAGEGPMDRAIMEELARTANAPLYFLISLLDKLHKLSYYYALEGLH
jgi:hypothetical protein